MAVTHAAPDISRRHRVRRVAKWAALCAALVTLWAWGLSTKWAVDWAGEGRVLRLGLGVISYIWFAGDATAIETYRRSRPARGWNLYAAPRDYNVPFRLGLVWPEYYWFPVNGSFGSFTSHRIRVPCWLPLIGLALVSSTLFYLDRKRPPPGHCQSCGYDLTGNISGRCPECGNAVETEISEESS